MDGSRTLKRGARHAGWLLALAMLVGGAVPALAGPAAAPTLDQWFPRLRPGQWIKVEGRRDSLGGLRAHELKIIAGDRDESQVKGRVSTFDPVAKSFRTNLGVQVVTDARTEVQGKEKHHASFATLQPGARVEVAGKLRKDGALLAEEIEIRKPKKHQDDADDDEIVGRIESVDRRAHKLVLLGVQVVLDGRTRLKSPVPD